MLRTICSLLLLPCAAAFAAEPSLTIYNQNFAVVRGTVPLALQKGVNQIHFADLTAQTDASSVVLRDPAGTNTFQVLEQNYRATPLSQALMLAQSRDRRSIFWSTSRRNLMPSLPEKSSAAARVEEPKRNR